MGTGWSRWSGTQLDCRCLPLLMFPCTIKSRSSLLAPAHAGGPEKGRKMVVVVVVYCGQMAGWIKMPLGMEVGLSPGNIMLDGDPAPPPRKTGTAPQFSAHVYCGQTAICIRIPLGTEVGLNLGHCVRWDPAPPPLRGHSPQFSASVRYGQMAGWSKMPLSTVSYTHLTLPTILRV